MQIHPSDIIASLALAVSIGSVYYAKKQSASAKNSSINDYRAHLSNNHERYRVLLMGINDRHRSDLRDLADLASTALTDIANLFDIHDNARSARPLRHLIHESSEMAYYTLKGQMSWKNGMNIASRVSYISNIEDDLDPTSNIFNCSDFRRSIHEMYERNSSHYFETMLSNDQHFCSLVSEMKQRTLRKKSGILLIEQQKILKKMADLLTALKPSFENSHEALKKALDENDIEHFPMSESSRLYEKFHRRKAKLDVLAHLNFKIISEDYAEKYDNYISIAIHNCTILHAMQDVHSWGWIDD